MSTAKRSIVMLVCLSLLVGFTIVAGNTMRIAAQEAGQPVAPATALESSPYYPSQYMAYIATLQHERADPGFATVVSDSALYEPMEYMAYIASITAQMGNPGLAAKP